MRRISPAFAKPLNAVTWESAAFACPRSLNSLRVLHRTTRRQASNLRMSSSHLAANYKWPSSASRTSGLPVLGHIQRRSMFIQTESTPNPESLKYVPGELVLDEKYGTGMYFRQGDMEVNRSPLAKKLLKIEGVMGVFLGRTFITITKSPGIIWQVRRQAIRIRALEISATQFPEFWKMGR